MAVSPAEDYSASAGLLAACPIALSMRAEVPLLTSHPVQWHCPNCQVTAWQPVPPPGQVKFHNCPGLHGLSAPLIQAGLSCKVTAEEREDYLGTEIQAMGDDGKAYMAVRTTRNDGDDLAVNAGLARARLGDYR